MSSPRTTFRAFERRKVRLVATLVDADGGAEQVDVVDLSLGGMRVSASRDLATGARVAVSMEVPTRWEPIRIPARVAWWGLRGGGLSFSYGDDPRAVTAIFDVLAAQGYE